MRLYTRKPLNHYCDNGLIVHITNNPVYYERTKHIEVDFHFIREKIGSKEVVTPSVRPEYQLPNMFIRSLGRKQLTNYCFKFGNYNIYALKLEGYTMWKSVGLAGLIQKPVQVSLHNSSSLESTWKPGQRKRQPSCRRSVCHSEKDLHPTRFRLWMPVRVYELLMGLMFELVCDCNSFEAYICVKGAGCM